MLKTTVGLQMKKYKFIAYHLVKYKIDNMLFYEPRQKLLTVYVPHGIGVGNEYDYLISYRHGFSSNMQLDCIFNKSFSRLTPKKTSKFHIIGILWKETGLPHPPPPTQKESVMQRPFSFHYILICYENMILCGIISWSMNLVTHCFYKCQRIFSTFALRIALKQWMCIYILIITLYWYNKVIEIYPYKNMRKNLVYIINSVVPVT